MRKRSRGFTLIEVLIAMAIMSASAMLLYVAWAGNQVRVRKMSINNQAAFYLDQAFAELEIKYRDRFLQIPESESGKFEDNKKFTWSMKSKDFKMPDLRALLISEKRGQEMILMVMEQLTQHLDQTVKEVQVTVTYKAGKDKTVDYTATTFFVDFNRPLPIGGAGGGGGMPGGGMPPGGGQ